MATENSQCSECGGNVVTADGAYRPRVEWEWYIHE
jgi:hypothetical protein